MTFTKKDLVFSLTTGLTTGIIVWRIAVFLELPLFFDINYFWLVFLVPILWIFGVNLGYFLGRTIVFFNQFGRFTAVGFTNAAVDFGILNILIAFSGVASGGLFSTFKGASFFIATIHSYLWNKYWVFEAGESRGGQSEFFKFAVVAGLAIIVNVGAASFIVNGVDPLFGFNENVWANVGAVVGSAVALVFSFVGFKIVVFKKKEEPIT